MQLLTPMLMMVLIATAGCSSLPTIVPDLARQASRPEPRLASARGPMSAAQSRAVLQQLRGGGKDIGVLDRHLALEEAIAGSPLTVGNRVLLLQDGPATYAAMFAAIAAARDHINLETYIFDDDEIGRRFADALIAKQQQGVQVNIIRDSAGTFSTPAPFFERLAAAGVNLLEFNPINPLLARKEWALNQRDHRKLLITDGHTAFLGGINISSVYSSGSFGKAKRHPPAGELAWRDTDLQLQGPVVADFQRLFLAAWANQQGEPLAERQFFPPLKAVGAHVVRAIGSSPDEPFSQIYATLLSAIHHAERSVLLTNAYFVPDPQLLEALEAAATRGVDVKLILPSQTDSWLTWHAGRAHYERLLQAGVKIYERHGVILHAKTALVDGVWATVGSTNLDWRSFLHNHELNAVVLGAGFGAQLQAMFDRDLAESEVIQLVQWRRRTLDLRFKEWFSGVWQYWL